MTPTRERLWTMGIATALVTAWALPALAAGHPDRRGPRAHRGDRPRHILTVEQMQQIRPWIVAEREAAQPLLDLRRQLRDVVLSEAPDQGKIAALQAQIAPLEAEALGRRTALAQRIAALLTPEQRQRIRASGLLPPFLDPAGPFGLGRRGPRGAGRGDL